MKIDLRNRCLLKLLDFNPEEIRYLLDLSARLKRKKKEVKEVQHLKGKNIALIFEKTSTRTRCAFEVAAYDQGAHVTFLGPTGSQMGHKESIKDTARVLGRMYDGIEYRGFAQSDIEIFAQHAGVPVWNGLTDLFHPTQVLADLLTMQEHCAKPFQEMTLCYAGDTRNNMCHSLMVGSAKMGIRFRAAGPPSLLPHPDITRAAKEIASKTGSEILIVEDLRKAVKGCDFLYTDVWLSLGEPPEKWEERIRLLKPYQINKKAMEATGNPKVKFLHCLPAFHNRETTVGKEIYQKFMLDGMEVTEEVFESKTSIVFDQAENRIHTAKAVMVATMVG